MFILKWFYSIKIRTYYIYIVLVWKIITCSWEELFAYYIENVQPLIFNAMLLEIIKISSSYKDLYLIQTLFNQHSANSQVFQKRIEMVKVFFCFLGVTITGEGLQILTCARYSWPLSSECSFTVTRGIRFEMVIPEDPWYSHQSVAERVAVELSLPVLTT